MKHRSCTHFLAATRQPLNGHEKSSSGELLNVGDTGIEPVTSSVSGKRATAAPIARDRKTGGWV